MRFTWALVIACYAAQSTALSMATPTLYLVGDSTMALHSASEDIQGWGAEVGTFVQNINVVNKAVSGRSARSYTREGRWAAVQALLVPDDYVIIEFGHNDGGFPSTSDRASVHGESDTATQTVTLADGTVEVVHTFPYYLKAMITGAKSQGATVIISSQTPDNPYGNSSTIVDNPPRFVGYAKDAAAAMRAPYVDHFAAMISLYANLGKATTDSYFPKDHTHTNAAGALEVARAFIHHLKCCRTEGVLASNINSVG